LRVEDASPEPKSVGDGLMWMNASEQIQNVVVTTAGLGIYYNSQRQMRGLFGSSTSELDSAAIRSFSSRIWKYQVDFDDEHLQTAGGLVLRQLWQDELGQEWDG
jgi:hypothetical protein